MRRLSGAGRCCTARLTQFVRDTAWGDLDYLIVDMPPGTGDVAISLSQLLDVTGAVVVCTPQDVALLDVTKAITMFRKVQIEVLGMVENMSFFICPSCNARHEIFGSGGAKRRAAEMDVPLLGEVPLDTQLRVLGDEGRVYASFDHEPTRAYLEALPHTLVANLVRAAAPGPRCPRCRCCRSLECGNSLPLSGRFAAFSRVVLFAGTNEVFSVASSKPDAQARPEAFGLACASGFDDFHPRTV